MNQRIGYARISTDDQNLDLQRDALLKSGCVLIYEEAISGKNIERPELQQCLKAIRAGDTLVVWRLDRLGRSLTDLIQIVNELEKRNIAFESLTEKIDTSSATGRLIFHVFGALSEFERNLIRERTQAGLVAARARGRNGGRPKKLNKQHEREILRLMEDPQIPVKQIADRYGVSRATIYKIAPRNSVLILEDSEYEYGNKTN